MEPREPRARLRVVRLNKPVKGYATASVVASIMLVATACGGTGSPTADEPEGSVTEQTPSADQPRRHGAVADAVDDLAGRLGVDPADITVVTAEEVTWRDGSLGCPRPGMMYPQVLTSGSRVVLESRGDRYEYHAGGRRSAFLCENPEPPAGR
jgi:hypothetical protein